MTGTLVNSIAIIILGVAYVVHLFLFHSGRRK